MISECFGGASQYHLYGLEEGGFLFDVAALMILIIPTAIAYALWRMFVTNRIGPRGTTILGLDENSATYTKVYDEGMSWRKLFLYGLAGFVFALETFRYLVDLLSA